MRTEFVAVVLLVGAGCGRSELDDGEVAEGGISLDTSTSFDVGQLADGIVPDFDVIVSVDDAATTCGPSNCKMCCLLDGTCATHGGNSSCGAGGVACQICPAGFDCVKNPFCIRDQPNCGPSNCEGCCWGPSICASGINDIQCGHQGEVCQACDKSNKCVADSSGIGGSCGSVSPPCSTTTCSGCCYGKICATGTQNIACGAGGVVCADCTSSSSTCKGGACK